MTRARSRRRPPSLHASVVLALAIALALAPCSTLDAQFLTRAHLDWRTVETPHFRIHYPASMEAWTRTLAERIESVHGAVSVAVGSAPAARVDVVVDDPYNVSNGLALASIGAPLIFLWPTPPEPGLALGAHRGWSELLAVHEYAHLAHLTRPSRNPAQRLLWRLLPENVGPIARRAPRWVKEGYATYIEGRLTGSGRPFGAYRPAVLRQFAIEGRLPTYPELDGSNAFLGASMAYLAGSAYLEWLVERQGEESLRHLWRRMTARADRGFVEAFRGVYGETPEDLYRRFTAELTGEALAIEDTLEAMGAAGGEIFQRRGWSTGHPAVSPDGAHLAVMLSARERPGRMVVWATAEEPEREEVVRARRRAMERDPEDVPAIARSPRPKRALATLHPVADRAHTDPRFFADGERILLTRAEPLPDGTLRPDIFEWRWRRGELRRITHGAAVRTPDPSPDGGEAAGVRCMNGICDLVIVQLATGDVRTLVAGSPFRAFSRPRWSRDGARIAVAVQERGAWRLAIVDRASGSLWMVPGLADVNRYDPAFLPKADSLVAIAEDGGIPNVVIIDVATGATRPLTRVTGAASAPEPSPADGWVYFLRLHGEGLDVARVRRDSAAVRRVFALDPGRFPAAPIAPSAPADTFAVTTFPPSRPYGAGPRMHRVLPSVAGGEQWRVGVTIVGTDPVGRLSWTLQAAYGDEGTWRGGAMSAEWRRWRPALITDAFHTTHEPSRLDDDVLGTTALDADYSGAAASLRLVRQLGRHSEMYRLGGSAGRATIDGDASERMLGFGELAVAARRGARNTVSASLAGHGSIGRTAGAGWTRVVGGLSIELARDGDGVEAALSGGSVSRDAPVYEQFVLGGEDAALIDAPLLSQRVALPALPFGARRGSRFAIARGALTGGVFEPYYLLANVGDIEGRWNRVIGIEQDVSSEAVPLFRLPAVRATAGVGYSLDEPTRKQWRWYITAVIRP